MKSARTAALFAATCLLLAVLPPGGAAAQSAPAAKIEPYKAEEFPVWALDLRRADIVAFGALPFTVFFSTFAIDSWRYYDSGWQRPYAPWPLKPAGAVEMDEDQRKAAFAAGCAAAVGVALVDFIIVAVRRNLQARVEREKPKSELRIKRSVWPPEAEAGSGTATPPAEAPPAGTPPAGTPAGGAAPADDGAPSADTVPSLVN